MEKARSTTGTMPEDIGVLSGFWKPLFHVYYRAYYEELVSAYLIARWAQIDLIAGFLTAVATSGSAVAGWALWSTTFTGRLSWAILAGIAAVFAIAHGVARVPSRLKQQEEAYRLFSKLRLECKTTLEELRISVSAMKNHHPGIVNIAEVKHAYEKLQQQLAEAVQNTPPDIILTGKRLRLTQQSLNGMLKNEGFIE